MRGTLLRSGKSGDFTALGETGQPVYRAALQLREAIARNNPEMAKYLAIAQSDEQGNIIDWYSELPGDVIPWSSATPEERANALVELEKFQSDLNRLSAAYLDPDHNGKPSVDRTVFGKLLAHVLPFPDENYVYLVNGKPVLTFWGFRRPGADHTMDPLHCLRPQPAPVIAPPLVAPIAGPVPAPAPLSRTVVARPWWRRWWWLLLLPLLLLLLFGLRSCAPQLGLPLTTWPNLDSKPDVAVPEPDFNVQLPTGHRLSVAGNGQGTLPAELPATGTGAGTPAGALPDQAPEPGMAPPAPDQQPAPEAAEQPDSTPPAPPVIPDEPQHSAAPSVPGEPLTIPADTADGQASFLNGHYRAGAGIQDKNTGKPLRLEYQFKDGKGEVIVRKANGINCTGPVTAAMQNASLAINSQGQAACSDGSSYEMPQVDCRSGAQSIADCTGVYEDKKFPISMRQTGE